MILFENWEIRAKGPLYNIRQYDNEVHEIVISNVPENWRWELLISFGSHLDIITMQKDEDGTTIRTLLKDRILFEKGIYIIQLRGTKDTKIRHTNILQMRVDRSLSGDAQWPEVPTEFKQVEQNIHEMNEHPPIPGENGYWKIWDLDRDEYVESLLPLPEMIPGPDGKAATIRISETETVDSETPASFIETEESTPQDRIYKAQIPRGPAGRTTPSDWNQNDDTQPDYIRNRICYEVFGKEYKIGETLDDGKELPLVEGHRYWVNVKSYSGEYYTRYPTEEERYYTPRLDEAEGKLYIGDLERSDPPFYIKKDDCLAQAGWGRYFDLRGSILVDADASTIYPIDSKFLSSDIGRVAFIDNPELKPVEGEENAGVATITKEEYEKCVLDSTQYIVVRIGDPSEHTMQYVGTKYISANGIAYFIAQMPNPEKNDSIASIAFIVQPSQSEDDVYELGMLITQLFAPVIDAKLPINYIATISGWAPPPIDVIILDDILGDTPDANTPYEISEDLYNRMISADTIPIILTSVNDPAPGYEFHRLSINSGGALFAILYSGFEGDQLISYFIDVSRREPTDPIYLRIVTLEYNTLPDKTDIPEDYILTPAGWRKPQSGSGTEISSAVCKVWDVTVEEDVISYTIPVDDPTAYDYYIYQVSRPSGWAGNLTAMFVRGSDKKRTSDFQIAKHQMDGGIIIVRPIDEIPFSLGMNFSNTYTVNASSPNGAWYMSDESSASIIVRNSDGNVEAGTRIVLRGYQFESV